MLPCTCLPRDCQPVAIGNPAKRYRCAVCTGLCAAPSNKESNMSYRYDFDRLSGTGILVRESDELTSLRYTGPDALALCDASPDELAVEAESVEFS